MHRNIDAPEQKDPLSHAVIGAAFAVHAELGAGFLETVYQEALLIELKAREIPFQAEAKITIRYKGRNLAQFYRADFICFNKLIVELKAQKLTTPADEAQVLNYLKASRLQRALLLNFGAPSLKIKRFVN